MRLRIEKMNKIFINILKVLLYLIIAFGVGYLIYTFGQVF